LERIESVPGCLQRLECGQPFAVFVDHSTSPHALANLLSTLRPLTKGNLTCLLGVDHRQSDTTRAQVGRTLERWSDASILTGSRLDRKMSLNAAHDVLDGFDRPAQAHVMPERARAICWALDQAEPGDVVVLAGALPTNPRDAEALTDEDVSRYWLQQLDGDRNCPWMPA
jgi:UDP-N-acetylmuramoyl-L-alanyl-D-glutamate--2,6-diaminopimelate ligase